MQSAEDRFGTERIRFSPAMAWSGIWKDEAAGRGADGSRVVRSTAVFTRSSYCGRSTCACAD